MSTGIHLKYFVLNPYSSDKEFAKASRMAMITFSNYISETNAELATDLLVWVNSIKETNGCKE